MRPSDLPTTPNGLKGLHVSHTKHSRRRLVWFVPRLFYDIYSELVRIRLLLLDVLSILKRHLKKPPNPGRISLQLTGETGQMLHFKIVLPELPIGVNDIVGGKLTVKVGAADPATQDTAKDAIEVLGFSGEQDAQVDATFVYVDDALNQSLTPSTLSVTLVDNIPPVNPGELGLVVTGESF